MTEVSTKHHTNPHPGPVAACPLPGVRCPPCYSEVHGDGCSLCEWRRLEWNGLYRPRPMSFRVFRGAYHSGATLSGPIEVAREMLKEMLK